MTELAANGKAAIPALGLGTWQMRGSTCSARIADALDLGYLHLDTAQAYENHAEVGEGIRRSSHPLLSQQRLRETLTELDMALVAYSPLAHGSLLDEPTLKEIAGDRSRSVAQIALRWLIQQDAVGAIPKASSRAHLEENLQVFDFQLDEDEMRRIHALARREGARTVEPDFAPTWER